MPIMSMTADVSEAAEQAAETISHNVNLFQEWWESIRVLLVNRGIQIILAIIIFLIGRKLIGFLVKVFEKGMTKGNCEPTVLSFGRNALRAVLYVVLLAVLLQVVGVEVTSLAAIIASAGVAVGLALQGSLSNLAGGILILLMHPFHVGDFITAGGFSGTVQEIGLVYTTMTTVDNHHVVLPNGTLAGSTIENFSAMPIRRVDVQIGIAYEADLKKAETIFRQVIDKMPERLTDQPVDVFVAELGSSSVTLEGRVWVGSADYWTALWNLRENIKLAYDKEAIKIPYPQVEVHQAGN